IHGDVAEPLFKGEDRYIPGGYVENLSSRTKIENDTQTIHIREDQLQSFYSMVGKLKKHKIPYLLVQTPVTNQRYKSYSNIKDLDTIFNSKGTYMNFNEMLNLTDDNFLDGHHLNQKGVNIYNKELIRRLEEINFLKTDQ